MFATTGGEGFAWGREGGREGDLLILFHLRHGPPPVQEVVPLLLLQLLGGHGGRAYQNWGGAPAGQNPWDRWRATSNNIPNACQPSPSLTAVGTSRYGEDTTVRPPLVYVEESPPHLQPFPWP